MRDVVILGSTGSIGTQALDVIAARPGRVRVVALTAGGGQPDALGAPDVHDPVAGNPVVRQLRRLASLPGGPVHPVAPPAP